MKSLLNRSLSGVVFLLIVLGALFWNIYVFSFVLLLVCLISLFELCTLLKIPAVQSLPVYFSGMAVFVLFTGIHLGLWANELSYLIALWPVAVILIFLLAPFERILTAHLGALYIGLGLGLVSSSFEWAEPPHLIVLWMLLLIWAHDVFAYISGSLIGKHPILPKISPGKTWEGSLGGTFSAILISISGFYFTGLMPLIYWLSWSIVVSISANLGDFFESWFKRTMGVKDSGNIMPGHGGLLDRFDALLLVSFSSFVFFKLLEI